MAGIGESQKQLMMKNQELKPEISNGVSALDELRKNIEYQLIVVRATPGNIRPQMDKKCLDELDTFIVTFEEHVVKIVNWISDAASLIHSEEMKQVELNKKIEQRQKEFETASDVIEIQRTQIEAASKALENLKHKEMAEQIEKKYEIEQVQDDASSQTIEVANIVGSFIGQLKTLEEIFSKFKNIRGSTFKTNDSSCLLITGDYLKLPGEINRKDELADVRIKNLVAKKTSKGLVFVPLLCSWINFLVDITYSMVQYSANDTFLMVLSSFSVVLPSVTIYFEYYRVKNYFKEYSPKREIAHDIFLDLNPAFGRRSKALVVSSAIASALLFGSAFLRVLSYFSLYTFTISVVIQAMVAFIQTLTTTITALENFDNPRLVCVGSKKVQILTKVEGLEPPVYYCNCPICCIIQESSDDIK